MRCRLSFFVSLVSCLAAASTAAAQDKIPPTIPAETTTVFTREMQDASDRALLAPSMYGNVLGTRWFVVSGPGLPGPGGGIGGVTRTLSATLRDSVPSDASFLATPGLTNLMLLSLDLNFLGTTLPNSDYTSKIPVVGIGQPKLPINEVPSHTAAIQAALAKPGETAVFNAASSQARLFVTLDYNIFLVYDFVTATGTIFVPNPADGGLAGRNRVSADSSPLPRDRIIFNYDFVSNAALMPNTPTMNRFVYGIEKTFLDGLGSIEIRLPFAATVSSTSNNDGSFGAGRAELGNLFLVTKLLLSSTDTLVVSGGMGLSLPTADDVRLQFGGGDVLRIRNEAVIMTPFVASLWTPTDRAFAQSWLGFGWDINGNPAQTNLDGKGLATKGRLYDPTTLQMDLQLGYWVIHPTEGGALRGFAPFVEFHYNQQLAAQNSAKDGPFNLTPSIGLLSEFDISTGFAAGIGENSNFMLGATFPIASPRNQFSDWQLGVRFNYFFGPYGRARASLF
jgi:hypothetical protein